MGRMLPSTDRAVAALINDLHRRGLLDSTIVWMTGEFGRTPKIDWAPPYCGGRGHWGNAFSQLIAGGGFKGGVVVGKTDDKGGGSCRTSDFPRAMSSAAFIQISELIPTQPSQRRRPMLCASFPTNPKRA